MSYQKNRISKTYSYTPVEKKNRPTLWSGTINVLEILQFKNWYSYWRYCIVIITLGAQNVPAADVIRYFVVTSHCIDNSRQWLINKLLHLIIKQTLIIIIKQKNNHLMQNSMSLTQIRITSYIIYNVSQVIPFFRHQNLITHKVMNLHQFKWVTFYPNKLIQPNRCNRCRVYSVNDEDENK